MPLELFTVQGFGRENGCLSRMVSWIQKHSYSKATHPLLSGCVPSRPSSTIDLTSPLACLSTNACLDKCWTCLVQAFIIHKAFHLGLRNLRTRPPLQPNQLGFTDLTISAPPHAILTMLRTMACDGKTYQVMQIPSAPQVRRSIGICPKPGPPASRARRN